MELAPPKAHSRYGIQEPRFREESSQAQLILKLSIVESWRSDPKSETQHNDIGLTNWCKRGVKAWIK